MNAFELSKIVIDYCLELGHPISNLQLQKILYYIQKEFLNIFNKPAFEDAIEAWKFGPVVPSVYYQFCMFGANRIMIHYANTRIEEYSMFELDVVKKVIRRCIAKNPWSLVEKTHAKGKAWERIFYSRNTSKIIPLNLIKEIG